jgi:adenosylcobinamide-GDP ribazoletransferase
MTARAAAEAAAFLRAVGFLTRLPTPAWATGDMAAALRYLPAVGALVGAVAAAALATAATVLPVAPAVLLSIAATCLLTGALHEDGLADTFDAIAAASAARALEIMRDSRIGAHGALALGLVLALKATALAAMPLGLAAAALVAGHASSRLSSLVVIATSRYARPAGTAGFAAAGLPSGGLAVATATAAATLLGLLILAGGGATLAAILGLAAGHLAARAAFERRIGGYTGDCLGATQQLSEAGLYLGVVAWL